MHISQNHVSAHCRKIVNGYLNQSEVVKISILPTWNIKQPITGQIFQINRKNHKLFTFPVLYKSFFLFLTPIGQNRRVLLGKFGPPRTNNFQRPFSVWKNESLKEKKYCRNGQDLAIIIKFEPLIYFDHKGCKSAFLWNSSTKNCVFFKTFLNRSISHFWYSKLNCKQKILVVQNFVAVFLHFLKFPSDS